METRFDPETPALYVRFLEGEMPVTVEESAEVILAGSRLCAVRVWLDNLQEELREHLEQVEGEAGLPEEPIERLVDSCLRDGWVLRSSNGRKWLFYQFSSAEGKLELLDWSANVDLLPKRREVMGIEFLFMGAPVAIHF